MKTMDRINSKYGQNTIKVAAQGSSAKWKLRQEKLSQCYTTRWNEIITVRV
jgi:DNA polymerase V